MTKYLFVHYLPGILAGLAYARPANVLSTNHQKLKIITMYAELFKIHFLHLSHLQSEHLQESPQHPAWHPGQVSKTKECNCWMHFQINSKDWISKWNLPGMMNLGFFQESETVTSKVRRWMADKEYFLALLFSESQEKRSDTRTMLLCVSDGNIKSLLHKMRSCTLVCTSYKNTTIWKPICRGFGLVP